MISSIMKGKVAEGPFLTPLFQIPFSNPIELG